MKKIHIRKPTYWRKHEDWLSYCGKQVKCVSYDALDDENVCKTCRAAVFKKRKGLK